jgi:hypothetical protein
MALTTKQQTHAKNCSRASATLQTEQYAEPERIADDEKVSVTSLVRHVAVKYFETKYLRSRRRRLTSSGIGVMSNQHLPEGVAL